MFQSGRRMWPVLLVFQLVFLLSLGLHRPLRSDLSGEGQAAASPADSASCPLCGGDPGVPVVPLRPAELDSVARAFSQLNQARMTRLDSLFLNGEFGSPKRRDAGRTAHLAAQFAGLNVYRYLFRYAADSSFVYEFSESTFIEVFRNYSDPGLFCIARLERGRMGRGRVCMRYDLSQKVKGETVMGGKRMSFRVKDVEIDDIDRRMLSFDLPTGSAKMVEVLLAEHYFCEVDYVQSGGPPAPYELFVVDDIHGGWLRKWGTHRPTAFMFWLTPQLPEPYLAQPALGEPLVGVRIYIPHLRLELPLLPDIDFDDLRTIELPQPIFEMQYLREKRYPEWLEIDENLGFADWNGSGEVPPDIRTRFPNH